MSKQAKTPMRQTWWAVLYKAEHGDWFEFEVVAPTVEKALGRAEQYADTYIRPNVPPIEGLVLFQQIRRGDA